MLLVFGLAALILFLTIPEERLDTSVFWIAFSISIPVNLIAAESIAVWAFAKSGNKFMRLPTALYTVSIFSVILLIVGFLYMYLDVTEVTWPIIIFAVIIVAYVIMTMYAVLGTGYMGSTEQVVKEKRLFIKMLEADVLDCAAKSSSPTVQAALRAFAENVRFSDPMSHAMLAGIENDISSLIYEISADLAEAPDADVSGKIARADALLKSRNNRCIMLK